MKTATRLTSKGQVVIPKAVRERMQWHAGMRLEVEELRDGGVCLRAGTEDLIAQVCGFLSGGDPISDLEAEHRAELARDTRHRA